MEGVEEANQAAINSSYRVLSLLSLPKNQLQFRQIALETGDSVSKFNKVVLLLSNNKGHARSRTEKRKNRNLPQINPICLLDHPVLSNFDQFAPNLDPSPSNSFQFHPKNKFSIDSGSGSFAKTASTPKFNQNIFLESPILEIDPSSSSVNQNHQIVPQSNKPKSTQFQFKDDRSKPSGINIDFENFSKANSVYSSLSVDGSGFQLISGAQSSDLVSPRPPSFKRKCHEKGENGESKCGTSGKCHCAKKRKYRVKKTIKVPAISDKIADIPPDDYSWRKYGQKPIKGSPHPRGYYKCSGVKGCPAKKHVERCLDEPSMLIVTYEGEHNHAKPLNQPAQTT
ncbi:hypothetical protein LUZ61_009291 [Rhynchospora tenuis]|uniref:WRKY domain-containing protein n=1 Tax=Rhynchospora tenuis TaxID=198213 RepID=A0AAD5ZWY3_9POAL|nr:hypothetical protein LUZ61_009291 [Rhynchospora tenuis]